MKNFDDCFVGELFPTPVYKAFLTDCDNSKLVEFIESTKNVDKGVQVSNIGGWHSNDISKCEEISSLKDRILEHAKNLASQMGTKVSEVFHVWANVNGYKDFNEQHTHAGYPCKFSGVYYVKVPENSGNLVFFNPAAEYARWSFGDFKSNKYTSDAGHLSVPGILYIFPSWVVHAVQPNMNTSEERFSISFNIS
jgi:uncharacterized protein (TIGR02466 family)